MLLILILLLLLVYKTVPNLVFSACCPHMNTQKRVSTSVNIATAAFLAAIEDLLILPCSIAIVYQSSAP